MCADGNGGVRLSCGDHTPVDDDDDGDDDDDDDGDDGDDNGLTIFLFEQVEDGQELAIIGDQGLT